MAEHKIYKYLEKRVRITTTEGRVLEGDILSVESPVESDSGEYELDVMQKGYYESVPESKIAALEVLADEA